MAIIRQNTVEEAQARSRELWEAYLGRPKRPEDVTEFLLPVRVRVETTGDEETDPNADLPDGVDVALVVPQRSKYLDKLLRESRLRPAEVDAVVTLYPAWQAGVTYRVDDLRLHADVLYRSLSQHTSRANLTPDNAPALWAVVV